MKIAISGIGGFIGKRAAEKALAKGWQVIGIESNRSIAKEISRALYIDVVKGDIRNEEDCQKAVDKADVIIHTAAVVKEDGNWDTFRAINVIGTENLAKAAKATGAKQFIHLSSVMVYGFHYPKNVDENGPLKGDNNPYCQTKIESEEKLKALADQYFHYTIIRPGDVYGPGSIPWVVRPLEMMKANQFMLIDGGKGYFNPVYIDNLIDAILTCIEQEAFDKTYNVTDNTPMTNQQYFGKLSELSGRSMLPSMPSALLKPLSGMYSKMASFLGIEAQVNPQAIRYMQRPYPYSSSRIRDELGFTSRVSFEKGMELTFNWLKKERPDLLDL